jgi:Domain of unknown function (DUF4440)
MSAAADVLDLERAGWEALSTPGAAGPFYERVLDDTVVFLLPGGLHMYDRVAVVDAMTGATWDWYRIDDAHVRPLGDDVAVVHYRAAAQRGEAPVFEALMASTYVRRPDGWRLAVHQQTPTG